MYVHKHTLIAQIIGIAAVLKDACNLSNIGQQLNNIDYITLKFIIVRLSKSYSLRSVLHNDLVLKHKPKTK